MSDGPNKHAERWEPIFQKGVRYDRCVVGHYYMPWLHDQKFLELYQMVEKFEGDYYGARAPVSVSVTVKNFLYPCPLYLLLAFSICITMILATSRY